jgi:urease accessory protein
VLFVLAAAPAAAHFGRLQGGGWSAGFAHPFAGVDPVLAMSALGLWSTLLGRRALWLLPGAFAGSMMLGAAAAIAGLTLPGAEDGVALSVALLGVLLAVAARPRLAVAAAVAALFGLAHGYAQGAAMPDTVTVVPYAMGFLSATALLLSAGIALGLAAQGGFGRKLLPIGAAALAGLGVSFVLAL